MTGPPDPTAALNERFTLYNADGKPVERMLHEMTADEVMAAVEWSVAETKRLDRAAEPARELVIAARKEGRGEMSLGKTRADLTATSAPILAAMEATNRHVRLLSLIQAAIPQWQERNDSGLRSALGRRFPNYGPLPQR